MGNSESEGLGLSLLVYMAAILGALAVLAVPVYFIIKPEVYANPTLARSDLLGGPIVGSRLDTPFPLARLEHAIIVDPAMVAGLNARTKKSKSEPAHRAPQRAARQPTGTPVADLQNERRRPTFSLFSLFGG